MSNESIASSISSGLRSIKGTLSGLFGDREKRRNENAEAPMKNAPVKNAPAKNTARKTKTETAPDGVLLSRAEEEVRYYTRSNQPLFDRAERYGQKAERLSGEGTSSETASNKAERARDEILAGLAALRTSFVSKNGEGAGAAFDQKSQNVVPNPGPT